MCWQCEANAEQTLPANILGLVGCRLEDDEVIGEHPVENGDIYLPEITVQDHAGGRQGGGAGFRGAGQGDDTDGAGVNTHRSNTSL